MNTHRIGISFIAIAASLLIWTSGAAISLEAQQTPGEAPSNVSPDLVKIVKLVESGVSEEVVLAYVRNSPVPKPNADEIVYLHRAGVSTPVLTALLSKNGTSHAAPASEPVNSAPAKPVYVQSQSAPASVAYVEQPSSYVASQPAVVYAPSYPPPYYTYTYPYYSYYPSYYPWPAISLGFGFGYYHGYGHHGGHYYYGHGYHGGHGGHYSGHGGLHYVSHSGRH